MNWVLKNLGEVIGNLVTGMLDFFNDLINNLFINVADVSIGNSLIQNATVFTTAFGIALITFIGLKQYFTTFVMETGGDPDSDPLDILLRCSQAVAICCANDFIFTFFMKFSKSFVHDLVDSANTPEKEVTEYIGDLVKDYLIHDLTPAYIIFFLILLIFVIGMVIFCILAGIRGAELSFMKILLPIIAADLVTAKRERWESFITSYIITFLYYGIQLLAYKMFVSSLACVTGGELSKELIIAFGWFIIMLRSPKWLEKFCYSTGVARMTGETVRMAPYMIMSRR